jgi:hypothetical protein
LLLLELEGERKNVDRCVELLAVCYLLFRMETQPLVVVKVILALSVLLSVAAVNDWGYTMERYDDSPGI